MTSSGGTRAVQNVEFPQMSSGSWRCDLRCCRLVSATHCAFKKKINKKNFWLVSSIFLYDTKMFLLFCFVFKVQSDFVFYGLTFCCKFVSWPPRPCDPRVDRAGIENGWMDFLLTSGSTNTYNFSWLDVNQKIMSDGNEALWCVHGHAADLNLHKSHQIWRNAHFLDVFVKAQSGQPRVGSAVSRCSCSLFFSWVVVGLSLALCCRVLITPILFR